MYIENPEKRLKITGTYEEKKSLNTIEKEHDMLIEDKKLEADLVEKQWKSCCFDLHPESSVFFAKLSVSTLIIILCSYQLITLKDCNYQSLYSSLLSTIITFWLSRPK